MLFLCDRPAAERVRLEVHQRDLSVAVDDTGSGGIPRVQIVCFRGFAGIKNANAHERIATLNAHNIGRALRIVGDIQEEQAKASIFNERHVVWGQRESLVSEDGGAD